MRDTGPAGPGLRLLILRHNPLWQLTFHRSEISRQGHPWVLFLPSPQCAAFKTIKLSILCRQCDALSVSKTADVPEQNYDKTALKRQRQPALCAVLFDVTGKMCSEIIFSKKIYYSLCQLVVCLIDC